MTTGLIHFNPEADIFRGPIRPRLQPDAQRSLEPVRQRRSAACRDAARRHPRDRRRPDDHRQLPGLTKDDIQIHLEAGPRA
ncbi:MAG: hypothetical protein R2862_10945 [Thermoanaerobaculia bacterium]